MQRQRLLLCTKQVEQDLYAAAGFQDEYVEGQDCDYRR